MTGPCRPILLAGAGAIGGALIAGWRRAGAPAALGLMIRDPAPGPEALDARDAILNPPDAELARAGELIFAVKPQQWRAVAAELAPHLAPDAAIVSVAAGVSAHDLGQAFGGRPVARVMPTLAVAIGRGSTALWSADDVLAQATAALFAPLGAVTRLADENLLHAVTAAFGSGPAYLYAFIEALEAGAEAAGMPAGDAKRMTRATVCGAAALLAEGGEDPAELRRRVTSAGGTTQAALEILLPELRPLMVRVVAAATRRSRELGG